jgi:hypothetical protein
LPFASKAQQRFLYAHPEKVGGKEKLKEWSAATNFSKIPQHVGKPSKMADAFKRARRG